MDIKAYTQALYHNPITIDKTPWGLSNDLYLIKGDDLCHVLRVPKNDLAQTADYQNERSVQLTLKDSGLDFKEVYYDADKHLRITEYVPDLKPFNQYLKADRYKRVIKAVKAFHAHEYPSNHPFDLVQKYRMFKAKIKDPLIAYEKYEKIIKDFEELNDPYIFSHNDIVNDNILFKNEHTYLIDYEYAGLNHPYFDLMSFITENQINDEKIREEIYRDYFDYQIDDEIRYKLKIIENAQNLLWAAWANMLYDSRSERVYREIFHDKYNHLKEVLL